MSNLIESLTRLHAQRMGINPLSIDPLLTSYEPAYNHHYGMVYGSQFWTTDGHFYKALFLHRPDDPSEHRKMIFFKNCD